MSEIKITITAPELAEAINNLAKALNDHAQTNQTGIPSGATPINTTCASVEESAPVAPTPVVPTAPVAPVVPVAPTPVVPTPVVPTAAPTYTLEMIAKAGTSLIDAGRMADVTALLAKYGVEALTALDPSFYGSIATELRNLGAQI